MLGCQSIVDRHDRYPGFVHHLAAEKVVLTCGTHHVAAAVNPQQRRGRFFEVLGNMCPDRHVVVDRDALHPEPG
ncbi:Uncharacterised protein [Mycobacteroides abscessus subsp. abscessus]|nr:Uncharacterised protein [Mycobacteroides abscessus subsp. abscessus]